MYFAQQRVCKMPAADATQASRKLHSPKKLPKNLRGGLRGATRKVRLRCKAYHAEERAAFRPATPLPQPPQNQLQLAECTRPKICRKICMLHCRVTQRNIYFW